MHNAALMGSCFLPGACSLAARSQKGLWEEWTGKLESNHYHDGTVFPWAGMTVCGFCRIFFFALVFFLLLS